MVILTSYWIVDTYKLFIIHLRLLYSDIVILHPVFKWTKKTDIHEQETCIYEWMINVETIKITEVLTREERDFFLNSAF